MTVRHSALTGKSDEAITKDHGCSPVPIIIQSISDYYYCSLVEAFVSDCFGGVPLLTASGSCRGFVVRGWMLCLSGHWKTGPQQEKECSLSLTHPVEDKLIDSHGLLTTCTWFNLVN